MYHIMAYCTREDPKSEIVWLLKKRIMFFSQCSFKGGFIVFISYHSFPYHIERIKKERPSIPSVMTFT
jgi:hypothetical protein